MSCTAAFNQKSYRGRNDDGNETTATWKANQNTNWHQAKDVNLRVRLEVQETAGCGKNNFTTIQLQYNRNSLGWNNVTGASAVVRSTASPNLADAAATTNQLSVGTGAFVGGGGFDEANGVAGDAAMDIAASGHFEVEFCVQILSADVASGDTIQLRATDGGSAFAAYDATPSITVSSGNVTVTPTTLALTTARFSPTIGTPRLCTPSTLAHSLTKLAPIVTATQNTTVTTASIALTASTFAPTVIAPRIVTPSTYPLVVAIFVPTASTPQRTTPATASLALTTLGPIVSAGASVIATPPTASLSLSAFSPVIATPRLITSPSASLVISAFDPAAFVPRLVTPPAASIVISVFAPTVATSFASTPSTASLIISTFAPTISTPSLVTPTPLALEFAAFTPAVMVSGQNPQVVTPGGLALCTATFAPVVMVSAIPAVDPRAVERPSYRLATTMSGRFAPIFNRLPEVVYEVPLSPSPEPFSAAVDMSSGDFNRR